MVLMNGKQLVKLYSSGGVRCGLQTCRQCYWGFRFQLVFQLM